MLDAQGNYFSNPDPLASWIDGICDITSKEPMENLLAPFLPKDLFDLKRVHPYNIYRNEDELLVVVPVPGFKPEEVTVKTENARLIIEAASTSDLKPDGVNEVHVGFKKKPIKLVFNISQHLDTESIVAKMEDGVLLVTIRRSCLHKPKVIPIQAKEIESK